MIELRSLKIDYVNNDYTLEDQQREIILRNLSNLKFLEYLQLNSLEQHLFKDSFEDCLNLIKDVIQLKEFSLLIKYEQVLNYDKRISLGKTLLALKNLTHFEFIIEQKDTNAWSGFFTDLSSSFKQMHNLLSLMLEFRSKMSQKGCHILEESFLNLQQLEKLQLSILFETEVNKSGLLNNLRKLSNLKQLQLLTSYDNLKDEEEDILLDSISQLNQLENLCLMKQGIGNLEWIRNLEGLSNALKNLRNLKELECGLCIQNLNNQKQLNWLEQCFENLSNLETLNLYLNINQKRNDLQNVSVIKHLINLKSLEIVFQDLPLNVFGSAVEYQQQIENIKLVSNQMMQIQDFIEIFESLSELVAKKLVLQMDLTDSSEYREQFGNICSKLSTLEKLSISEEGQGNLMQHLDQIKQMKSLKSLNLSSYLNFLTKENIQMVNETLISLNNLQKLSLTFSIEGEVRDLLQLKLLKNYRNLKYFHFSFYHSNEDEISNQTLQFTNACYLDLQQHHGKTNQTLTIDEMQNQGRILHEHQFYKNQMINEDNLEVLANNFHPIKINIDIQSQNYKENTITLSELDFINLQFLNHFQIKSHFDQNNPVIIQLLQPMRALQSYSKLTNLDLQFESLIFNQEQLCYFSKNFQFLTNLQSFKFTSKNCWDGDHLLFNSLKYLINLDSIEFQIQISDNGAISLGNSLKSMTKLQDCQLIFQENNPTLELEGISSIFKGFQQLSNMKSLKLIMKTEQILKDYQINLSECLSNMKCLEFLHFNLEINTLDSSCLREFIASIGSFRKLKKLNFTLYNTNLFNQDMVDDLFKAVNQLAFLKVINIQIYLEQNVTIRLSEELASIFNRQPNERLIIRTQNKEIIFYQSDNIFSLISQSIEKVEMSFLECLNERVQVTFQLLVQNDYQILKNAKLSLPKNVSLTCYNAGRKQFEILGEFLSKALNIFELKIVLHLSLDQRTEDSITKIASIVTKLPNLKVLTLSFFKCYDEVDSPNLREALKFFKNMQQLQDLSLQMDDEKVNRQVIPQIQKTFLKLVKLDKEKQIYFNLY